MSLVHVKNVLQFGGRWGSRLMLYSGFRKECLCPIVFHHMLPICICIDMYIFVQNKHKCTWIILLNLDIR